jgi:hypothetical protein
LGSTKGTIDEVKFRCPDCAETFFLWKTCVEHCTVKLHGGWPRAKGLRKRCRPADQQAKLEKVRCQLLFFRRMCSNVC